MEKFSVNVARIMPNRLTMLTVKECCPIRPPPRIRYPLSYGEDIVQYLPRMHRRQAIVDWVSGPYRSAFAISKSY